MGENDFTNNNRAEELRKRRTQRSQQKMNVVNNRVVNPVNPRPVIVRGSSFGTPIHRQAGTRARRQFYVTVDQAAGAELRLPALPLINPGWRLLSGLIAVLAAIGVLSLYQSPFFRINSVDLLGPERVTAADLNMALELQDVPVIELNQKDIEEKIAQSFPELVDVSLTIELPNFVTITASERRPVAVWQKGDQTRWVDAEGYVFPVRGDVGKLITISSEASLPLVPVPITGEDEDSEESGNVPNTGTGAASTTLNKKAALLSPEQIDPTFLLAAEALSKKLPPETTLVFDQANGLGWSDPQGFQVYVGRDLNQFEAKYTMYQQIAAQLSDQGLRPSLISVQQVNAPFYRLEQ